MDVIDLTNLPLKFGQNGFSNGWYIVVVVIVVDVVVVVVFVVHVVAVIPRNKALKFGQDRISSSWDIDDVAFSVVRGGGGGGVKSFSCQTQLLSWVGVELRLWQLQNNQFLTCWFWRGLYPWSTTCRDLLFMERLIIWCSHNYTQHSDKISLVTGIEDSVVSPV